MEIQQIDCLIGKKAIAVEQHDELLAFALSDGTFVKFYHSQDCCESVTIEDIDGDVNDLLGTFHEAEMVSYTPNDNESKYGDSETWTFYKFSTEKGFVSVRWVGSSNGYYSESVEMEHYDPNETTNDIEKDGSMVTIRGREWPNHFDI